MKTALTKQCSTSNLVNTVGIVVDTNDEAARNLCGNIANRIRPLTSNFGNNWKLQIFSPYREDKPLAVCHIR